MTTPAGGVALVIIGGTSTTLRIPGEPKSENVLRLDGEDHLTASATRVLFTVAGLVPVGPWQYPGYGSDWTVTVEPHPAYCTACMEDGDPCGCGFAELIADARADEIAGIKALRPF